MAEFGLVRSSFVAQPLVIACLTTAGAIFGVAGALAVFFHRHRGYFGESSNAILRQLGQALAINTLIGLTTPQVDQW